MFIPPIDLLLPLVALIVQKTIKGSVKAPNGSFVFTRKTLDIHMKPQEVKGILKIYPVDVLEKAFAKLDAKTKKKFKAKGLGKSIDLDGSLPDEKTLSSKKKMCFVEYALERIRDVRLAYPKDEMVHPDVESGIPWTTIAKIFKEEKDYLEKEKKHDWCVVISPEDYQALKDLNKYLQMDISTLNALANPQLEKSDKPDKAEKSHAQKEKSNFTPYVTDLHEEVSHSTSRS